jgi:hypothetical protein
VNTGALAALATALQHRDAIDFGIADYSQRACREQTAQIAIASFADIAEPVLASTRVLFRDEPDSGREVPP